MHRNHSIRSRKSKDESDSGRHRFAISSLRSMQQPELSKKLFKLIKSENHAISAHDTAGRERISIANQLSEWGEATEDDAVSEISDKLGVLLAEIGEQEDSYAQGLEEYRGVLKQIRNTEGSVQPARDHKVKISDELAKLKHKEPTSTKIVTLEQELVRAEAQSLVAEAQLTNTTRQKLKEAYLVQTAALIERCEKQALLARHARAIVELLDDTPVQPGDNHIEFARHEEAVQILNEAERDLRAWKPSWETHESVTDNETVASPVDTAHNEQGFQSSAAGATSESGDTPATTTVKQDTSSTVAQDGSAVGTAEGTGTSTLPVDSARHPASQQKETSVA